MVLCNRLSRIQRIVDRAQRPAHWLALAETPESRRIGAYLRSKEGIQELDTAGLLRQRREVFRIQYIEFLGELNRNNSSLEWWGLAPTTKNPITNTLCMDVSGFRLIVDLVEEGYQNLMVVADSDHLGAQVKEWAKHRGIDFKCVIKHGASWRKLLKLYTPAPVAKAFLVTMYRWLSTRQLMPRSLGPDGRVVIVGVTHAASYATDGSNDYRDVYFQPLMERMQASGRKALVIALIRGRLKAQLPSIKKLNTKVPVVPLDAFLTFPDILWCLVRSLWRSAVGIRIKGSMRMAGVDTSTLVRSSVTESYRSGDLFMSLRFYRATERMARKIPTERFIYPLENRTWEKMMVQALRDSSPRTRLVGYQHAAITPSHLHFFLGEGEAGVMPLPDVILTAGDFTGHWLQREGGYPPSLVRAACALRQHSVPMRQGRNKTGRVLVAMGNSLDEYVRTLIFLKHAVAGAENGGIDQRQFVIRPHPNLTLPLEQALEQASISGNYRHSISTGALSQEISETDVLAYASSTVAIEAASAGVPTVCLDLGGFLDTDPMWGWEEFKWRAEGPESLLDALEEIDGLTQEEFETRSHKAREYASSYLVPVSEQRMSLFLEA